MDIIGEYFYVIILIIGAIAQWMKSRSDSKAGAEEARRQQERGEQEYSMPDFDPEEMQEWAAPRPAVPPPLPAAQMVPPPPALRRSGSTPPAVPVANLENELQRQAALAEQMRLLKQSRKAAPRDGAAAAKERLGFGPARQKDLPAGAGFRQRLGNNRELKNAFVLKEILEKPIGLR